MENKNIRKNKKQPNIPILYSKTSSKNKEKPYKVYKTESSNGKVYVGESKTVRTRIRNHCNGSGSQATKKYTPVKATVLANFDTRKEAKAFEKKVTNKEKIKRGKNNVRGAGHTSTINY